MFASSSLKSRQPASHAPACLLTLCCNLNKRLTSHEKESLYVHLQAYSIPNCFSPICLFTWTAKLDFRVNARLQWLQTNGFSPVWILIWAAKWLFCANALLQSGQTNGLSPVWILICPFKVALAENVRLQSEQTNCFLPVWSCMWRNKLLFSENHLLQSGQTNGFSPVWIYLMIRQTYTSTKSCMAIRTNAMVSHRNDSSYGSLIQFSFWTLCSIQNKRMASHLRGF